LAKDQNLKDLYMIIKEKISVMISVNLWLNRAPEESQVKKLPIFRQNYPITANAVF